MVAAAARWHEESLVVIIPDPKPDTWLSVLAGARTNQLLIQTQYDQDNSSQHPWLSAHSWDNWTRGHVSGANTSPHTTVKDTENNKTF